MTILKVLMNILRKTDKSDGFDEYISQIMGGEG